MCELSTPIQTTQWFGVNFPYFKEMEWPTHEQFQRMDGTGVLKEFYISKMAWFITGGVHLVQFGASDGLESKVFGGSYPDWHKPNSAPTLLDIKGSEIKCVKVLWNDDSLRGLHFLNQEGKVIAGEYEDFVEGSPLNFKEEIFELQSN